MSNQEMSPEEKVRQNNQLKSIDEEMKRRAHATLLEKDGTAEIKKDEAIIRLLTQAPEAALRLSTELDPDFTYAFNAPVSRIVQMPSRLPFVRKEVSVLEQLDIASWNMHSKLQSNSVTVLGHDGSLYELESLTDVAFRPVVLHSLELSDLLEIEKSIAELLETQEMLQQKS